MLTYTKKHFPLFYPHNVSKCFHRIVRDKYLFESDYLRHAIREFKQITTAGATTAAVLQKVRGEYVSVSNKAKYKDERYAKEFKISF